MRLCTVRPIPPHFVDCRGASSPIGVNSRTTLDVILECRRQLFAGHAGLRPLRVGVGCDQCSGIMMPVVIGRRSGPKMDCFLHCALAADKLVGGLTELTLGKPVTIARMPQTTICDTPATKPERALRDQTAARQSSWSLPAPATRRGAAKCLRQRNLGFAACHCTRFLPPSAGFEFLGDRSRNAAILPTGNVWPETIRHV